MGDISKNFSRWEFACKCGCGFDVVDVELLEVLETVRFYFGKPVGINSPNRCFKHNEEVLKGNNPRYIPGSSKSQHLWGKAADIIVKDVHADEVADYLETYAGEKFGIGRYTGRTHIDVRAYKARWDKRQST